MFGAIDLHLHALKESDERKGCEIAGQTVYLVV